MPTLGEMDKAQGTKVRKKIVDVVEVKQHGDALIIPEGMPLDRVDAVIHQKMEFDATEVEVNAKIEGFIPEAAYAVFRAFETIYGWVNQVPTPGFFGAKPPATITVDKLDGTTVQVPWGRFSIPNLDGYLQSGITQDSTGRYLFVLGGVIKRKHQADIDRIVDLARKYVAEESIYRGKAFRVRLRDDDGDQLAIPEPKRVTLNTDVVNELVFTDEVMLDIAINLFTPICETERVRREGKTPLKRGVLLAGEFGVGKTMAAHATAVKCIENGWTYIVCERSDELADVLRLARMYQPAVVFTEDIDRIMTGDRDKEIDHILNVVDGVDSKDTEIMIVLTTNDVDNITPALLRPGRLDAVIRVDKPDAKAAERLARQYSRGLIAEDEDISEAAAALAGRIPAVIREAVERSKLAAIHLTPEGEPLHITNAALLHSAKRMQVQLDLLEPKSLDTRSETVKAAEIHAAAYEKLANSGLAQGVVIAPPILPLRDSAETLFDDSQKAK